MDVDTSVCMMVMMVLHVNNANTKFVGEKMTEGCSVMRPYFQFQPCLSVMRPCLRPFFECIPWISSAPVQTLRLAPWKALLSRSASQTKRSSHSTRSHHHNIAVKNPPTKQQTLQYDTRSIVVNEKLKYKAIINHTVRYES